MNDEMTPDLSESPDHWPGHAHGMPAPPGWTQPTSPSPVGWAPRPDQPAPKKKPRAPQKARVVKQAKIPPPPLPKPPGPPADWSAAAELFTQVATADEFVEFLTLPAYERLP